MSKICGQSILGTMSENIARVLGASDTSALVSLTAAADVPRSLTLFDEPATLTWWNYTQTKRTTSPVVSASASSAYLGSGIGLDLHARYILSNKRF